MSASFLLGLRNASLLCPRATFARDSARPFLFFSRLRSCAALPSCYVRAGQRSLRTSPAFPLGSATLRCFCPSCYVRGTALSSHFTRCFKTFALFDRQMAAHTGASCLLRIPRCETGCDACSHKSAKSAENIELPYLWLRNDGGTEPDRGHSVSFSWPAYPSVGRQREPFQRGMPC